jgi:hypothetical protein
MLFSPSINENTKLLTFSNKIEYVSLTEDDLQPGLTNQAVNNILMGELIKGMLIITSRKLAFQFYSF